VKIAPQMVESTEFCVRVMGAELQIFDKT